MSDSDLRTQILEHLKIGEDSDYEFKAAQGRGGKGELPHSFWESYSGMANTEGGYIVLGIREENGKYEVCGITEPSRIRKEIWDGLHNREVVSTSILRDTDVRIVHIDGEDVVLVHVPRAKRRDRPVFLGRDLFTGTFRRRFEGDYRCDGITVKRMLAEAQEESRDSRILPRFGLVDLVPETIERFRACLKTSRPDHPWADLPLQELLQRVGGWSKDRDTGEEGPTLAGLLAFGQLRSILDEVPTYVVDYQVRKAPGTSADILRRITTDGSWSGNLLDFYLEVLPELADGLDVPPEKGSGIGPHARHITSALAEALVNSLIHADFSGTISILITKQPGFYSFRNPGGLRIPLTDVLSGGISDCRNRNLQTIFQLAGAAEKTGSGVTKILRAWQEQGWRTPLLREHLTPEMTTLQLPLASLIPEVVEAELREAFPGTYDWLSPSERIVLATAKSEESVTNSRVREISPATHPFEVTKLLRGLVAKGFLVPQGSGRGSSYSLSQARTASAAG